MTDKPTGAEAPYKKTMILRLRWAVKNSQEASSNHGEGQFVLCRSVPESELYHDLLRCALTFSRHSETMMRPWKRIGEGHSWDDDAQH